MKVILDLYNLNLLIRISTSSCRQRHPPHSLEVFLREKLYPILTNLFSGEQSKTLKPHCVFAMLQSPPIVQSAIDEITKKYMESLLQYNKKKDNSRVAFVLTYYSFLKNQSSLSKGLLSNLLLYSRVDSKPLASEDARIKFFFILLY